MIDIQQMESFLLGGGAVSWLSKKQAVVALSTSEAEYIALSSAAHTNEMNADLLTQPLPKGQFEKHPLTLGIDVLSSLQSLPVLKYTVIGRLTSLNLCDLCTFISCSRTF